MKSAAPYRSRLREAQAAGTRQRILDGVAAILERGDEPTYALVAGEAGCQERTVYRHFPTKELLAAAFWDWQYQVLGPRDRSAASLEDLSSLVGRAFPAFDRRAALVRAMLHTRHGKDARLSENAARKAMTLRCVDHELPDVDPVTRRRVAAATQLLFSASAWEVLRDYWSMNGTEAAATVQLAMSCLFEGARRSGKRPRSRRPAPATRS
ncbi:MAG TPA: TetR/AcrR family transcriptional regulator [Kofleriaceae bacterium]|nr:TetR/AcrR family transcriptional regulator [Kofleriaceae bacterium]